MAQNFSSAGFPEKISIYTELFAKDPHSTIFVPLCEAYRRLGRFDEAIEAANKGIMQNPSFPAGYVALGRTRYQQEQIDQAVDAFEKALLLDKDNLAALKGLAKIRLRQKDWEAARELLDHVISLDPGNLVVMRLLTILEKQATASGTRLKNAFRDEPKRMVLAERVEEEQTSEPIATITIAEIYIRQGFPEKALKVYRDLLRVNPQNDQVRQKLIKLEQQIEEKSQSEGEVFTDHLNFKEATEIETTTFHDIAEIQYPEPAAIVEPPTGNPVISILTHWLDAIARRREVHVR